MENENKKWAHEMNTEDFNVMREMISAIEVKIMGVDPMRQKQFYQFLQNTITYAWMDACDPENPFLFSKEEVVQ